MYSVVVLNYFNYYFLCFQNIIIATVIGFGGWAEKVAHRTSQCLWEDST